MLQFSICFASAAALAADIQISASLDRQQVAMNEQAVLRVTISGNVSNLPAPQMPGLQAFQVSNAGTSQSFSWVNGQASASVTHTFFLTPTQVGEFTIPPIRLAVEGKTLESAPLALKVVKGDTAAVPSPGAAPSNPGAPAASGAPIAFVTATADKTTAYVGEPITFSFRLYNRAAFLRQPQYQPPEVSGFWAEDLPPQRNFGETVKGVPYQVVEVRTALFPTHPGKATIGSATLNVALQNFTSDPYAGDFFNFFNGGETRTLRTEPLAVHVNALPEPAPAGFRGAVGDYTLTAELDKKSTTVGQPLTLSLTVAGRGNIKSLPDISLPPLANFRTFDANAATNIDKKNYHVQGSKVFKSVLIPTTSGTLSIPSVSFVYFDPGAHEYKTLKSRPLDVRVQPAAPGATPAPLPNAPGAHQVPGINVLNQDIRYIKTPAALSPSRLLYHSKAFIGLNVLALLGMLGCGIVPLVQRIRSMNPVQQRFREAGKAAGLRIKEAELALSRSDAAKAGSALSRALQGYLAAKFNQDEAALSLRAALGALQAHQVSAHSIEKTKSLWNRLDLIQFAPAQSRPEDIRESAAALRTLLAGLEKEIAWRA